ncbi:hypothetical protein DCM91_11900 [Chitinophaga costaii]|nr:hypothetical protein DCM91_11900 [Chitinophaga costaii]
MENRRPKFTILNVNYEIICNTPVAKAFPRDERAQGAVDGVYRAVRRGIKGLLCPSDVKGWIIPAFRRYIFTYPLFPMGFTKMAY